MKGHNQPPGKITVQLDRETAELLMTDAEAAQRQLLDGLIALQDVASKPTLEKLVALLEAKRHLKDAIGAGLADE